jgi:hypothetical protein
MAFDGIPISVYPIFIDTPPGNFVSIHRIMKIKLFSLPMVLMYLITGIMLLMTFDVWESQSRYLYFSTEIILLLFTGAMYAGIFKGEKWNAPPEPDDDRPEPNWKRNALCLIAYFFALGIILCSVWVLNKFVLGQDAHTWFKSGMWYLYYVGIFGLFFILVRRHLQYIHVQALWLTIISMVIILVAYEVILLSQGTGWEYNRTVIGWLMGVPVDNILFIYPVAPALCIVLYTLFTRHLNNLKAFWYLMALLIPSSIVVELIGIYPLDLWEIFNDQSILPMGQTNLEEFVYYVIFQLMSVTMYLYFARNLKDEGR